MIELKENFSLEKHNTLKLKVKTKFFIEVFSVQDLLDAIAFAKKIKAILEKDNALKQMGSK